MRKMFVICEPHSADRNLPESDAKADITALIFTPKKGLSMLLSAIIQFRSLGSNQEKSSSHRLIIGLFMSFHMRGWNVPSPLFILFGKLCLKLFKQISDR